MMYEDVEEEELLRERQCYSSITIRDVVRASKEESEMTGGGKYNVYRGDILDWYEIVKYADMSHRFGSGGLSTDHFNSGQYS